MVPVWLGILSWVCVIFVLLCALWAARSRSRMKAIEASLLAGWQDEAPRLPPAEIKLRTGESLLVEPRLIDRIWLYEIDAPPPDLVREVVFEAPLHCQVIPKVGR